MRALGFIGLAFAALLTTSCSSMKPEDFKGKTPELRLDEYFKGKSKAYGVFEDRFGKLRREFVVDVVGTVDGDTLTLDESFRYKDGETDHRIWSIRKIDDHHYNGTSPDIIGTAKGAGFGNGFTWTYDIDLKVGKDSTWRVNFTDWFYLSEDGVLLNRAHVTRFGVEIGTLTIAFRKLP